MEMAIPIQFALILNDIQLEAGYYPRILDRW